MNIAILVPYENAELWAYAEKTVDFENDAASACRCTVCFAAVEAKHYISRCTTADSVYISQRAQSDDFSIAIHVENTTATEETFSIIPIQNGVQIMGKGRIGALYGVYEFLSMQGIRWYEPGDGGTYVPPKKTTLTLPKEAQQYAPQTPLGRGFDFEGILKENEDLWLWMAHNKLNLAAYRPNTYPLLKKLGMQLKNGGHIFEVALAPDRMLPSGQTIWEAHPEWYGTPKTGEKTKARALATQFCVSAEGVTEFLAEDVISCLESDWRYADRIDVWNFDSWGGSCCCEACQKLGNTTDKNLYFLSALRSKIDDALQNGRLSHPVRMALCAYEGTLTLEAPTRPIPKNLLRAGDYAVFYPISRCYAHDFDGDCPDNKPYREALADWLQTPMPVMVGEYYNVSRFEDLPLQFTERITHDLPYYIQKGVGGFTYMHLPMLNWGVRTLTHYLYAQLAWNAQADSADLLNHFFEEYYGDYAISMRQVYTALEKAWRHCTQWRAWSKNSILSQLNFWDGTTPKAPLLADVHFPSHAAVIAEGNMAIQEMELALQTVLTCRRREKEALAQVVPPKPYQAVNPIEQEKNKAHTELEVRLCEAMRQLQYGIDMMRLMCETVQYYDAAYRQDVSAQNAAWNHLETTELAAESRYMPLRFGHPKVTLTCLDEMERSRLAPVLRRIRKQR